MIRISSSCVIYPRSGNTKVVPALFRLIGDPDARVAQAASAAIQSLGSNESKHLALAQAVAEAEA